MIQFLEHLGFRENIHVSVLELVDCHGCLAGGGKNMECLYAIDFLITKTFDPNKAVTDFFLNESTNVQLHVDSLKIHDTKFTVMSGVEHNISPLFSNVSKRIIVNKNIWYQKEIYNAFGFSIFKKPHSVFKPKSYGFYNRNVGIFSGNGIITEGYHIKMHRY